MSFRFFSLCTRSLFLAATCLALTSCIFQQPAKNGISFAFAPKTPQIAPPQNGPTLSVRIFDSDPSCEQTNFSYRVSSVEWETDYYNTFSQPPDVLATYETRRWLASCGIFKSVSIPGLAPAPSYQLQGFLSEIYGDFTDLENPKAVITLKFAFYAPGTTASSSPLLQRSYHAETPFAKRTPAALVAAWDLCLESILSRLANDLRKCLPPNTSQPAAPTH